MRGGVDLAARPGGDSWSVRFVRPALWIASFGVGAGLVVMYASEAERTVSGRTGSPFPVHVMPYVTAALVAYAVAVGVLVAVGRRNFSRGVAGLGAAAAVAALAATPADGRWHSAFGIDSLMWSPAHLLSVVGAAALVVAALTATGGMGGIGRIGLASALLGVLLVVLIEYDTDVPQLPEVLYLPVLLLVGLGWAWVCLRTVERRRSVSWALAGYLAFRVVLLVVLTLIGLPGPDLPVALLGLVVLDVPPRRWRWPVAGLAVSVVQLVASVVGLSSVSVSAVVVSAAIVLAVWVAAFVVRKLGHVPVLVAVLIPLVAGASILGAPTARAHDPGSGPRVGAADVIMTGDGAGALDVRVDKISGVSADALRGARVVARRAGRSVAGDRLRFTPSAVGTTYAGSVRLPRRGTWFVYVEMVGGRGRELWQAVEYSLAGVSVERREIYEPSPLMKRAPAEYLAAALLYLVSVAVTAWAVLAVRRSTPAGPVVRR